MIDWTAVGAIWPIFAAGFATVIGVVIWAIRAEGRSTTNATTATEALRIAALTAAELASFRERVAQEYATMATVASFRAEILDAINRLGDRIDRVLEANRGS
jgi:hypothetical protein